MQNYKPSEFAKLINVSVKTLQRWDREGTLKAHRSPTNRRFYTHEQYEAFIQKNEISPTLSDAGRFVIGDELKALCAGAMNLGRRDVYRDAEAFLNRDETLRTVGIIYGMRSTGKTIILRQLAGREALLNQSAYATLNYGEYAIDEIYKWIATLYKTGIRYFYIDEVTWADGFIDRAMEFADVWASYEGVKIILSGTDSLAFTFAKQESLHGRYEQFTTTKMSYPEYFRILEGGILDYVHSGGVFWKKVQPDSEEFEEYLESSVVRNIHNSILNTRRKTMFGEELRFVSLKELYAICHGICTCVAAQYIYGHAKDAWGEPLVKALDMVLKNCGIYIPPAERNKILPYAPVFKSETSVYDREKVDAVIEIMRKIGFLMDIEVQSDVGTKIRPMISQTGVAREFALTALKAVIKSQSVRNADFIRSIEEYTDGELLDLACILTFTKRASMCGKDNVIVYKYRSYAGDDEVDVIVFDMRTRTLYLYEVKRGTSVKSDYAKHLANDTFIQYLQDKHGAVNIHKAVLYRGEYTNHPKYGDAILYYKIEDYLLKVEEGKVF